MYSIFDEDGFKGEIGSAIAIKDMGLIAKRLELPFFSDFIKNGFTINLKELRKELSLIDTEDESYGELEDQIKDLLEIVEKSEGIIILSDDNL